MNVLGNILSVAWLPVVLIFAVRILVAILNSPRVKGKRGEKIVARKLQTGLPEKYVVLNDVYLPLPNGTTTQIDHIKSAQIPEIALAISEWQGTLSDDTKEAHVANLNARHHGVSADDHPRCPRCGGEMVLRTAKSTGRRFFGCAAYPKFAASST